MSESECPICGAEVIILDEKNGVTHFACGIYRTRDGLPSNPERFRTCRIRQLESSLAAAQAELAAFRRLYTAELAVRHAERQLKRAESGRDNADIDHWSSQVKWLEGEVSKYIKQVNLTEPKSAAPSAPEATREGGKG